MLKTAGNGRILEQIKLLRRDASTSPEPYTDWAVQRMTKYIPLTRGYVALVDEADYSELARHKWSATKIANTVYAVRGVGTRKNQSRIYMHRVILGLEDPAQICDHVNGNGIDNRRKNLRVCERVDNNVNVGARSNSTHGYKGLMRDPRRGTFTSVVRYRGERHWVGSSASPAELALARDIVAARVQGEYAWLNFPQEIVEAMDKALNGESVR